MRIFHIPIGGGTLMKQGLRALAVALAITLMLPLAACKKKKKDPLSVKKQRYVSGQEIKETDPYFDVEINQLQLPIDESKELDFVTIDNWSYVGGAILAKYYISYVLPEDVDEYNLSRAQMEEYYVNGTALFDASGKLIKKIAQDDFGVMIYDIDVDRDGNIVVLCYDIDHYYITEKVDLHVISPEGEEIKTFELSSVPPVNDSSMAPQLNILQDGRYLVAFQGKMVVYDQVGKLSYTIEDPGRTLGKSIINCGEKTYVISSKYDFEKGTDMQIKELNLASGTLGKSVQANYLAAFDDMQETENGLFVTMASGCYQFDIEKGELRQIFDWNDTDIRRDAVEGAKIFPKDENEILAISVTYDEFREYINVIHLTRAEKNPHAGKRMVVVGGVDLAENDFFLSFLYDYNHDPKNKARAVVVDYSEESVDEANYADIETQIYLDILSGEGPDVLMNLSDSSAFQTGAVLDDMNPYLDGADGISRDDYFDNILRAMEKDGKLYHVPIRVILTGFQVNSDIIQKKDGWTFEEFEDAANNVPAGISFVEGMKYDDFLGTLLYCNMSSFVDYGKKTVDFQSEKMRRLLQLTAKFGVRDIPADEGMDTQYDENMGFYLVSENRTDMKFEAGLLAARKRTISNLFGYCINKDNLGFDTSYLGYPSESGQGMAIYIDSSVGIVSTSKFKDLAWDLIRAYMEYDPKLSEYTVGLPINRQTFEDEMEIQRQNMQKDYDRTMELVGKGGEFYGVLPLATEEDIDEIRRLMSIATDAYCYDKAMLDVVLEESAGYFAGDRSEDDVLKTIQNRASIIAKEK